MYAVWDSFRVSYLKLLYLQMQDTTVVILRFPLLNDHELKTTT